MDFPSFFVCLQEATRDAVAQTCPNSWCFTLPRTIPNDPSFCRLKASPSEFPVGWREMLPGFPLQILENIMLKTRENRSFP